MAKSIRISSSFSLVLLAFIGLAIAILPHPEGVDPKAFPVFGIFVALIVGILLQPYDITVITLSGFFVCVVLKLIPFETGLACFGRSVPWLIVFASTAARAFFKTNLSSRIAIFFIKKTGKTPLRLAYGLTASEFLLSPMIPSNTARASCVMIPLTVSISESLNSDPKNHTEKVIGRFLSLCSLHSNQLTGAVFLTALASNPILRDLMGQLGVSMSWAEWFFMASVPSIICLFVMPLILYKLSPPEVKRFAKIEKLSNKSGDISAKISKGEWITIFVFAGMLFFWVFGDKFGLSITLVALGGLCILLLTRVLSIDDVLGARDIWSIFIWLSILNIMAEKLVEYGLIQHYALVLNQKLVGLSWGVVLVFVSLIYYFARYLIPGNVLHACAMFLAFANVLIGCGVPPKIGCMTLAMITAFCGFVTPYANSSSPLYMNTGYIEQKLWWRIGFITSFIYLFIYFVIGAAWWKFLGYW